MDSVWISLEVCLKRNRSFLVSDPSVWCEYESNADMFVLFMGISNVRELSERVKVSLDSFGIHSFRTIRNSLVVEESVSFEKKIFCSIALCMLFSCMYCV